MSIVSPPSAVFTSPKAPRFTTIPASRGRRIVLDSVTGERFGVHPTRSAADLAQRLEAVAPRFDEPCFQCGAPTPSDFNADPHLCPACNRMAADSALNELRGHTKALLAGEHPFDAITPAERQEQLFQLLADDMGLLPASLLVEVAGKAAEEIARRMGSVDAPPAHIVRRDLTLTELMSEEPYYVGGEAPDAATRDDLESRIELDLDAGDVPAAPALNLARFAAQACGFNPDRPAA
jgi:hypothetical protein